LFVDVKRSTQFLMEYQNEYMYNELAEDGEEEDEDDEEEEEEEVEEEKETPAKDASEEGAMDEN